MGEKLGAAWRDLFPEEAAGEDARDLFTQISKSIGVDGARRVFQNVLRRRRGRRKTKDETLLEVKLLTRYKLMQKQGPISIKKFARHVYETRSTQFPALSRHIQSPEAVAKRLERLLVRLRDK